MPFPDVTVPQSDYLFYKGGWGTDKKTSIDKVSEILMKQVAQAESGLSENISGLSEVAAGELNSSHLLGIQMKMTLCNTATSTASSVMSSLSSMLRTIIQNVKS